MIDLHFVVPLVNQQTREIFEQAMKDHCCIDHVTITEGNSHQAMAAADVVLLASGTAALEGLLLKRPMVVSYKVAPFTAWLARKLLKVPYVSLPNLLAGERLIHEFLQEDAVPEKIGPALLELLEQSEVSQQLNNRFNEIHQDLRRGASESAAEAIIELVSGHDTAK
jgi:lipid-A-disaccharide synthase